MKYLILITVVSLTAIMSYSQTSVEQLKKDLAASKIENQKSKDEINFLNEKLNFYTAITSDTASEIKSFSSLYSIKVVSCMGDRNSQTIIIDLLLEHNSTNQSLAFNIKESKAVNSIGQEYKLNNPGISTNYYSVFSNTPQRLTVVLNNVVPGTDMLSLLALKMATRDINATAYKFDFTEIRNLKIVW
jgi:hypothetical protein